jgi:hypothetical protein
MPQTVFFGEDIPTPAAALPSNSHGLSWYDVQRQRLKKFATQYLVVRPLAVETLRSQGESDVTIPDVVQTREGFTQLRRDLPVMDQYFEYSGSTTHLAKVKQVCLAWARTNRPNGKPINESNFEWLLRVMARRKGDFSSAELSDIDAWVQSLREAKESAAAGKFSAQMVEGEGATLYGNWWTHHYKVLLLAYRYQGDTAASNALLAEIDAFAPYNFPYGNGALTTPVTYPVVSANLTGQRFDISGDHTATFTAGVSFNIWGNSLGNDGSYIAASSQYLGSSNKTRIITQQGLVANGGGGVLCLGYDKAIHDMPRPALGLGESIDYIRRDALHYQVYNLMPWIEIDLLAGGRYGQVIANGWNFFTTKLLSATKHYEFDRSSDTFDGQRWAASHPEYLAPEAMFKPSRAAGLILSYFYHSNASVAEDAALVALTQRATDTIASFWPQHFRWALGYGANV